MQNLKSKLLISLAVAFCLFNYSTPGSAEEVEAPRLVTAIEVRGDKGVPGKEISDVIFSRAGETVSPEKIKGDLKAIYALGYFADVSTSFEAWEGGSRVIFNVVENPKIAGIAFNGNTIYSTAYLLTLVSTKKGEILNYKKLQLDIESITALYKKDGYILARVTDVDTDKKTNILHFSVLEGKVEAIVLEGNESTKDYVILRELKTQPGSVLNETTLKKDLRRVFNLGFFSEVTPDFLPGTSKESVVLQLKITETRSSTINFGGGYGEREGWFGFVDLSINNLAGTAQGLLIRAQSGQELSTYQFRYSNPWFWPQKLGDHAALTFRRWLTVGRDIFVTTQDGIYNGFDIALSKPLQENWNITWSLGSENVSPYGASSFEAYRSDTLGLGFSFDTRDFWLNPKEGRYYTLDMKQGWKVASGTTNFFKIGLDLNHYQPLFQNQILAVHGGVGVGLGDVPIGEVYYIGGANTVRGYSPPSESRIGKYKLLANAEYRLNFNDLFQGVFFYDWGNAWDGGKPDFNQFLWGWGPGIRVNTPLGPIRLDYGVAAGKTFSEGIMHFSIGQAF